MQWQQDSAWANITAEEWLVSVPSTAPAVAKPTGSVLVASTRCPLELSSVDSVAKSRRPWSSLPLQEARGKGKGNGKDEGQRKRAGKGDSSSTASRQVLAALDAKKKEFIVARQRVAAAKNETKAAEQQAAKATKAEVEATGAAATSDEATDLTGSTSNEAKALRKQHDALRIEIKKMLAWDSNFLHLYEQFGGRKHVDAKRAGLASIGAILRGL